MTTSTLTPRTVKHALFEYTDAEGRRSVALRGEQVRLSEADLARGERFDAFLGENETLLPTSPEVAVPPPAGHLPPAETPTDVDLRAALDDGRTDVPRPAQVAAKGLWVDYAVSCGMDRKQAEAMSKPELIDYPFAE